MTSQNSIKKESFNPLMDLELAFNSIGSTLYSDEFACELLAWFHVCGANNEAVVLNAGLWTALKICASKLGIEGGETPNAELFIIWKQKVNELNQAIDVSEEKQAEQKKKKDPQTIEPEFPAWLHRIVKRYELRAPGKYFDF